MDLDSTDSELNKIFDDTIRLNKPLKNITNLVHKSNKGVVVDKEKVHKTEVANKEPKLTLKTEGDVCPNNRANAMLIAEQTTKLNGKGTEAVYGDNAVHALTKPRKRQCNHRNTSHDDLTKYEHKEPTVIHGQSYSQDDSKLPKFSNTNLTPRDFMHKNQSSYSKVRFMPNLTLYRDPFEMEPQQKFYEDILSLEFSYSQKKPLSNRKNLKEFIERNSKKVTFANDVEYKEIENLEHVSDKSTQATMLHSGYASSQSDLRGLENDGSGPCIVEGSSLRKCSSVLPNDDKATIDLSMLDTRCDRTENLKSHKTSVKTGVEKTGTVDKQCSDVFNDIPEVLCELGEEQDMNGPTLVNKSENIALLDDKHNESVTIDQIREEFNNLKETHKRVLQTKNKLLKLIEQEISEIRKNHELEKAAEIDRIKEDRDREAHELKEQNKKRLENAKHEAEKAIRRIKENAEEKIKTAKRQYKEKCRMRIMKYRDTLNQMVVAYIKKYKKHILSEAKKRKQIN